MPGKSSYASGKGREGRFSETGRASKNVWRERFKRNRKGEKSGMNQITMKLNADHLIMQALQ